MDCDDTLDPGCSGLPDTDALLAATLSLMTAWANPCAQARVPVADLRRLLARKVVSNLFFLQHHPAVQPALRQVIAQTHALWVGLACATPASSFDAAPAPQASALHH